MSWRDDLRRVTLPDGTKLIGARFRGVPFFIRESERSGGGRRIVTHEFPLREDPYLEDLGRGARIYRVEAYVIGADYLTQRDDLLSALEDSSGPSQLIHPYYGTKTVICGPGVSVHESTVDGGMAMFGITFHEAPAQGIAPTAQTDLPGQVTSAGTAASAASSTEFASGFSTAGMPGWSLASAVTALTAAATQVRSALGPVIADTQELAAMNGQIELILAEANALITQPLQLLAAFELALSNLENTAEAAPGALSSALLSAYNNIDWGPTVVGTTSTRVQEIANQAAIEAALGQALVIEAATLAPSATYDSIDDATAARDALTAAIDALAANAGDVVYPTLVDLRAAVVQVLPGDAVFARVTTVTRRSAIPSLLLAYQLYGSVDNEADILARNDVPNPTFCVGALQVLTSE